MAKQPPELSQAPVTEGEWFLGELQGLLARQVDIRREQQDLDLLQAAAHNQLFERGLVADTDVEHFDSRLTSDSMALSAMVAWTRAAVTQRQLSKTAAELLSQQSRFQAQYIGRSVTVRALDADDNPLTRQTYHSSRGYWGNDRLLSAHPTQYSGRIQGLLLEGGTMTVAKKVNWDISRCVVSIAPSQAKQLLAVEFRDKKRSPLFHDAMHNSAL